MSAVQYIDTYEFTQLGQDTGGELPLPRFSRFLGGLPDQAEGSAVKWSLQGERNTAGERFLRLHVQACPRLSCQRCLLPLDWPIDSDSRLQLVNSEADLDDMPDDEFGESIERIVGARRFDVLSLVEDELILSLPYVPKHDVCPSDAALPGLRDETPPDAAVRPSPFAALGKLKKD
ncbi:MAG TPA: DUF177 domain-containing protein [Eoetvoesiella sp.]|uniref:YceD family protein n=1 Tax=Eoetvoesiella sp. TaxID=1966355 RepID=UPI002BA8B492|nr:DUF177 domain-containing protein [Eoetvoesiella sp.]HWK62451.1 DUF177 domain-containing protein [Eoetvoesiella sp.]